MKGREIGRVVTWCTDHVILTSKNNAEMNGEAEVTYCSGCNKLHAWKPGGWRNRNISNGLHQRCINTGRQVAQATKCFTVAPCWFSVRNWCLEFFGGSYIFRIFLHPLPTPIFCNEVFYVANCMEQNPSRESDIRWTCQEMPDMELECSVPPSSENSTDFCPESDEPSPHFLTIFLEYPVVYCPICVFQVALSFGFSDYNVHLLSPPFTLCGLGSLLDLTTEVS
jgi:hypothetical protein